KSINEYTEGSKEKFYASPLVQDAVIRNLQVMAESSQRISDALKKNCTDIAWRDISGFRNILVHDYLGVDPDTVWSVVEQDIPSLYNALKKL
ncbi:MAG: HepT-like ribonuclease domain-containing protein, partial [Mariprofundaceae bacterium]